MQVVDRFNWLYSITVDIDRHRASPCVPKMAEQQPNALNVNWVFGFSKSVTNSVHSLVTRNRNALFFISSHSGVVYDFEHRTQLVLQGHCNTITCCAVSKDKRWIVTADSGVDSILVVWDSLTGAPVKTYFSPHNLGACSLDFSADSLFVASLGVVEEGGVAQDLALWAWTSDSDSCLLRERVLSQEHHHIVCFNPSNQAEIMTTGTSSICFWTWREVSLEGYVARIIKSDIGHYSGKFTASTFLPGTNNALTATSHGYTILWEGEGVADKRSKINASHLMRRASKVLRLAECSINIITTTENGYFVIGCHDGAVRMYDMFLRLEAWFEDLSAGPVLSLSFAVQACPYEDGEGGSPGLKFWAPDFLVGTSDAFIVGVDSACFDEVKVENRRGTLLLQGMAEDVSCVACHPAKPLVVFGCMNGTLQIWDYDMKLLMNVREFNHKTASAKPSTAAKRNPAENLLPQYLAFDPLASFLAIGFSSGIIRFINVDTFADMASFAPTFHRMVAMKFSSSGAYLAAYDDANHVMVFRRERAPSGEVTGSDFIYLGRILSHKARITGIEFGLKEGVETLVSVSEDRTCVEYDLEASSVNMGVVCSFNSNFSTKLGVSSRPTAVLWHPALPDDIEERFVVASDDFKFKEYNADSKQCRRTTLTPTFGGPITLLAPLKAGGMATLYAYSTAAKVIGIGCLPLTGNPSEVMGLVAHPSTITGISVSYDSKYLFSAGGSDLSINMWLVDQNYHMMCMRSKEGVKDVAPYYSLLEGGEGGDAHNEMKDCFYYCQVRAQGEDSMEMRDLSGRIPLAEIPSLARSLGFYPTEEEVLNMINEVRYRSFMNTGELHEDIDFDSFLKLYLNHRPVLPLSSKEIDDAFATICRSLNIQHGDEVMWKDLKTLLSIEGEALSTEDLETCLSTLVEADKGAKDTTMFDSQSFAADILGFEDFEM